MNCISIQKQYIFYGVVNVHTLVSLRECCQLFFCSKFIYRNSSIQLYDIVYLPPELYYTSFDSQAKLHKSHMLELFDLPVRYFVANLYFFCNKIPRQIGTLVMAYIRPIHGLYTAYIRPIYGLYTAYIRPIHGLNTAYIRPIHGLYTAYIRPIYGQ